mmetsp:Transcript_14882/g.19473  ORF Transcript_14882/g.19473 Transcript_14882/m.19473 type:complete len:105 (-) Transcript_14882:868-1182(-)
MLCIARRHSLPLSRVRSIVVGTRVHVETRRVGNHQVVDVLCLFPKPARPLFKKKVVATEENDNDEQPLNNELSRDDDDEDDENSDQLTQAPRCQTFGRRDDGFG